MALPIVWPLIDGSGQIINKAAFNNYDAQLNAALTDAFSGGGAGTTRTPGQTTGEVVDARGSTASLSARLAGVVALDGSNLAEVSPFAVRNGLIYGNALANDSMMMWSRGAAAAPDYYALSGAGVAIAQCGVGLADTTMLTAQDHFSAKVTFGSATAILSQKTVPASVMAYAITGSRLAPVDATGNILTGYGDDGPCWAWLIGHVFSAGTNRARMAIVDTAGGGTLLSDFHPGDSQWRALIAGPVHLDDALSTLQSQFRVESSSAYVTLMGTFFTPAGIKPMYLPARTRLVAYQFNPIIASPVAATGYGYLVPGRPFHALAFKAECLGAVPTGGTTLKLDLMTPVGGTFVSLFAALPAFVASDRHVFKEMDTAVANYRRRTIRGNYAAGGAANLADNSVLRLDVNTRDSGNTATNILCTVIGLEYDVPFNQFRTGADLLEG